MNAQQQPQKEYAFTDKHGHTHIHGLPSSYDSEHTPCSHWVDPMLSQNTESKSKCAFVGAQNLDKKHIYNFLGHTTMIENGSKIPGRGFVYIHGLFKF
jgi:hypothetical protein